MKKPEAGLPGKNIGREILIRLITFSLPFVFILLIEIILRIAGVGEDLNLFIENPAEGYEEYMIVNPVVGKKYFQKFEYTSPPNDIFLKKKAEGSFRIFVMGSSTVVGFPHQNNLMFSRILHRLLEDLYPDRKIEMVNTAITAINSYTLLDYARQITKYEPDAVLIYAGHNEFYGAFGVGSNERMSKSPAMTRLNFFFMDFRFFQALKNGMGKFARKKAGEVRGTLMKRMVGNPDIALDSEAYEWAMYRYQQNMGKILESFSANNVPVFLSEVVSNVKDIKPFSAVSSGEEDEAWNTYSKAVRAYNAGEYERAGKLFNLARDMDGVRFRASGEVNDIIHELGKREDVHLVPMLSSFRANADHGIVGNELMTEHVHPNIRGAFLMAFTFLDEIAASDIPGVQTGRRITMDYLQKNWGYSSLDSLLAHHRITNLEHYWPFRPADRPLGDYRKNYRPSSLIDSLAFEAMRNPDLSIEELRLDLARKYEKQRAYYPAYLEYEALLRTNPYLAVNYRDAASSLIMLGHLPQALDYFQKSLEYEPSFYATYRIGEIYLIKGDFARARSTFQKAFEEATIQEDRLKAMGKLYQSCIYGGQKEDASALADQLKQYNASEYLKIPPPFYSYTRHIPYKTRPQVEKALDLMKNGAHEEAAAVLKSSLQIYDSHMARRYLGECYLAMGEKEKAMEQLELVKEEFAFDPLFSLN